MSMYVVTHKKFDYKIPKGYIPLLVGASRNKNLGNYLTDNTGINISEKNQNFCELTGIYWVWKNCTDANVGVSHYRRYFSEKKNLKQIELEAILKGYPNAIKLSEIDTFLKKYDWIVPEPYQLPEITVYEQFSQTHNVRDLEVTKQVIKEMYPDYITAFDDVMTNHEMSLANMCYTRKKLFDSYCQWLFDILFEVEKRTDISNYDDYQKRLYGFLAERLMNVWMKKNEHEMRIKFLSTFNTTTESRSNFINKMKTKFSI